MLYLWNPRNIHGQPMHKFLVKMLEKARIEDDCIVWTGGGDKYGVVWVPGLRKQMGVHVVAFALTRGYWPAAQINHTCDRPKCFNPEHLYEGTQSQNMRDMVAKGRHRGGPTKGVKRKRWY